jgi:hypothetical protein
MAAVITKIFTALPTSRQLRTYIKSLNTLQICTLPPYINLIIAALRFYPSVFLCKLRVYILLIVLIFVKMKIMFHMPRSHIGGVKVMSPHIISIGMA